MKRAKRFKKFMAMIIAGTMVAATVIIANAEACDHGGEEPQYVYAGYDTVDCISAGVHPCYVNKVLTSCQMYRYKYINYIKCARCGEPGQSYFTYSEAPIHQYAH